MLIVDGGGSDLKWNGDNRGQFFSFGETKFGQQLLLSRGRLRINGKKRCHFFQALSGLNFWAISAPGNFGWPPSPLRWQCHLFLPFFLGNPRLTKGRWWWRWWLWGWHDHQVGMTDADYLAAWHQVVPPLAAEFHPDLVSITSINNIIISISISIISISICV